MKTVKFLKCYEAPLLRRKEPTRCLWRSPLTLAGQIFPPYTTITLPVFATCHPFLFTAIYMLAGWLFINGRVGWRFQMWALERPSPSQQLQLSQLQLRLTLYQTVFLPHGDNHSLFTRYNKSVTLNEDERCAGTVIAVWAFLRTAYSGNRAFKQQTNTRICHVRYWGQNLTC